MAGTFAYSPVAGTVLPAGNQALFVTFTPTDTTDYTTATASAPLTVQQATTSISLSTSVSGQITYGTPVTITASVTPSDATGIVTFSTASTVSSNGSTTSSTAGLAKGSARHAVTAAPLDAGSTTLGTASLANGSASLTFNNLPLGSNTISATYSGDANDSASSGSLQTSITVTTVTVSIVPDSIRMPWGGPEPDLPWHVEDASGNIVSDDCFQGRPSLDIGNDASGNAYSLTPPVLNSQSLPDTFPITVNDLGNFAVDTADCRQYSGSNVNTQRQGSMTVNKNDPIATLDPLEPKFPYGQNYNLQLDLSNDTNHVPVTGTVTFTLYNPDNSSLGSATVTISNGQAQWTPCNPDCAALSPASYHLEYEYSGDFKNDVISSSAGHALEIDKSNTITTFTTPQNCPASAIDGNPMNFTVQVAADTNNNPIISPLPADPTGYVGVNETLPSETVTSWEPLLLTGSTFLTSTVPFSGVTFPPPANAGSSLVYGLIATYEGTSTAPTDGSYQGDTNYNSSASDQCNINAVLTN